MNLKQALKQKNVLALELMQLYSLIRDNNSIISGNTKHYNIEDLMLEADSKLLELVSLKSKIHEANTPVFDKIFMMSELKSRLMHYKNIRTLEGRTGINSQSVEPVIYEVQLNVKQLNEICKGIEIKINEIQEELDEFNSITKI